MKYVTGPFEIMTDAGSKPGRETLVRFEEFRAALGQILGEQDLQASQPVRIMLFKNAKGWTTGAPISEGRDRFNIVLADKAPIPEAVNTELIKLFLNTTTRMPARFEQGLIEFFTHISVNGITVTAGTPPQPDLDWARIHLLMTDPQYYGRIRVLFYNLRRGVDEQPAYRNAFSQSPAEIEARSRQHLAAGNFQPATLPNRPLSAGDFAERPVSDTDARLARADLLAGSQSAAEYDTLIRAHEKVAEAEEGLGLLALRDRRNDEARRHFAAATEAGSSSARCYIEYAKLEPDNDKATTALLKAAGINPKLDEPFALMAQRDTDPRKRVAHWKAAAERNPRNGAYWQALADSYLADHKYGEAAKAWTQGEQAAIDPATRERMRQARLAIEQQRLDYEEAEKRRQAEENAKEMERLKAQARAELHAAETKANAGTAPQQNTAAVPWWEGPHAPGKVQGTLKQVDCLGKQARLVVESEDQKTVKLLVVDPSKIAVGGPGEVTLGCGVQKSRLIRVEYYPKANPRLGTVGEVATIEFQ